MLNHKHSNAQENKNLASEQRLRLREYSNKLIDYYNLESGHDSQLAGNGEIANRLAGIQRCISQAAQFASPYFDPPIETHRTGFVGSAVVFTKKIIRKLMRFMFMPQADKNYQFQLKTLEALKQMAATLEAIGRK